MSLVTKKDYLVVSIIGVAFGLLLIPILENIQPIFWHLSLINVIFLTVGFFIFSNLALKVGDLIGRRFFFIWQFVKFCATGSLNAALDIGILNFLSFIFRIYSGSLLAFLNVISVSIAMLNSYFLNKFWAFKNISPMHFTEFIRFILVSLTSLTVNTFIVYFLTTIIGTPESISESLWENISKLIGVPFIILINFTGYKFLVFKK